MTQYVYGKAYRESGYDFTSYLLSSDAFLNGRDPYQTGSSFLYVYPLFFCIFISPFLLMPYWLQNLLWFLGSSFSLYLIGVIMLRNYSPTFTRTNAIAILIIPFLLLINVIQNNLLNGQANIIVLLLCILFLKYYLLSSRLTALLFLSAAIAIKLTPLILLVYLLFRRDYLMIGVVILTSLILSFVVPYIIGGTAIFDYYSTYMNSFLIGNLASNTYISQGPAFSITSIIDYLIPSISKQFSIILAGTLAIAPISMLQLFGDVNNRERETLIFSLYMLAILLITPMCETHHLINIFPALLVIIISIFQDSQQYFKIGAFILSFVLCSLFFGKFYLVANLFTILTLYSFIIWIILKGHSK